MDHNITCYKTVSQIGRGEIVEKKSRFLASVYPVSTTEEAEEIIEGLKKQYWDARHNCYAYVIGTVNEQCKCSDDGEPSGTAGKPMLEVLQKEEIKNVLVVVTRYFGGVLLGTGGLVRAYTQATKEGLDQAKVCTMKNMSLLALDTDYNGIGKVKYILANESAIVESEEYTEKVRVNIAIAIEQEEKLKKQLIEATSARIKIEETGSKFLPVFD